MISNEKYKELLNQYSWQFDLLEETMQDNWSYYERKINDIWSKPINPVFGKSDADCFKEKKLVYEIPLADILSIKNEVSPLEFSRRFPLTVGELLEVTKGENKTEQHTLISICVNEFSPRGWALRGLL